MKIIAIENIEFIPVELQRLVCGTTTLSTGNLFDIIEEDEDKPEFEEYVSEEEEEVVVKKEKKKSKNLEESPAKKTKHENSTS